MVVALGCKGRGEEKRGGAHRDVSKREEVQIGTEACGDFEVQSEERAREEKVLTRQERMQGKVTE